MKLDWDDWKNDSNKKKHGISFQTASLVFDDPFQLMVFDRYVEGEERWQTIGMAGGLLLLLVVHTYEVEDGEEFGRLISAREVVAEERKMYEANV
ncbi:MAG: BrnT family toxin [Bryocella sp.]